MSVQTEPETAAPPRDDHAYRVAHFTNTYLPFIGGVPLSVDLYRRYLTQRGDQVAVYAPAFDGDCEDDDGVHRLPAIKQVNGTDFSLPLPFSFKPVHHFDEEAYDVVHVHHPFLLGEMGMRLARNHRLPLVFTYHTQYERYVHYTPLDQEAAATAIIEHAAAFATRADLVLAPTSDIRNTLRKRGVEGRIEVLPTGVELARYEQADAAAGRTDLGIPADAKLLLTVGRIAEEKNLPYLLEACLRVLESNDAVHLALIGDGPALETLRDRANEAASSADRIHFVGSRSGDALRNAYAAADLFVFASTSETQGMVIAEAMAASTPVIALNADGVRELLRDGENGRMLDADTDPEAFAEAIRSVLDDTDRLAAMREAAHTTAADLDMPKLADRLHGLYVEMKLLPNRTLRAEPMSFSLIRHYLESAWEQWERWLREI